MTELAAIAELAVDADLLVITDEVYEHLVFDGHRHIPLANYPGMADRTITISSAAKMFNCTGWKIGWACGAAELIAGVRAAKQYLSYVGGAPFQPAVAQALNTEEAWVAALRESLQAKRDKLGTALAELGFEVHDSFGTYFLCADPRPLGLSTTARRSAPSCPNAPAWPRFRCRRSATRAPSTPTRGITWCASPSASATTPSTRQSADSVCCVESNLFGDQSAAATAQSDSVSADGERSSGLSTTSVAPASRYVFICRATDSAGPTAASSATLSTPSRAITL